MKNFSRRHKVTIFLALFTWQFLGQFLGELPAAAESSRGFTSRACPYSCALLGLSSNECSDYRVGDTCYVKRKDSGAAKEGHGARICLQAASGRLRVRDRCLTRDGESEVRLESLRGEPGTSGPPGESGPDGTLKVYGDGSAGSVSISGNIVYNSGNSQYQNFSVESGATLVVPSGTVIRCTGSFSNSGTIIATSSLRQHPKISENGRAAITLESGGNEAGGGQGGSALPEGAARQIHRAGLSGGGDGYKLESEAGSSGGGNIVILCQGQVTNAAGGVMRADGEDGGELSRGGGAGGIIILASRAGVTNDGAIQARGGNGAGLNPVDGTNTGYAAGGGGGGGIVHLMAPVLTNDGTIDVSGGSGGPAGGAGSITAPFYLGGGGGGASGGDGGRGGKVNEANIGDNSSSAGADGSVGKIFISTVDPTSLF